MLVGEPFLLAPEELPRITATQFRLLYQCERDETTGMPLVGKPLTTPEEQLRAKWEVLGASPTQRDLLWSAFCQTRFGEIRDEWVKRFDAIMGR